MITDLRQFSRAALTAALLWGCAPTPPPAPVPMALPPLPQLPPVQPAPTPAAVPATDPLAALPPGPEVTLAAVDVDVRALVQALAEAAELSIVLGPQVQGQVTVNLVNVPAVHAIEAILGELGFTIAPPPLLPPHGPAVFLKPPVNLDAADAETIRRTYGVSAEMSEWIIQNRVR
jgi:hypothetical protein